METIYFHLILIAVIGSAVWVIAGQIVDFLYCMKQCRGSFIHHLLRAFTWPQLLCEMIAERQQRKGNPTPGARVEGKGKDERL